jgi:hypothetical protein
VVVPTDQLRERPASGTMAVGTFGNDASGSGTSGRAGALAVAVPAVSTAMMPFVPALPVGFSVTDPYRSLFTTRRCPRTPHEPT